MKLKNLLSLTLTALASQSIGAMNKDAIAARLAAEAAAAQMQANQIELKKIYATLPDDICAHIGEFYAPSGWRNKFFKYAARYTIGKLGSEAKINELSTDGTTILSVVNASSYPYIATIKLWDINTARRLQTITWEKPIKATALSTHYMAIAEKKAITVVDRRTGKPHCLEVVPVQDEFRCVSISADERYLACATTNGNIIVWQQTENGNWQKLHQLLAARPEWLDSRTVVDIIFSPYSKLMVTASQVGFAQVWDLETGACKFTLPTLNRPYGMSMSPQSDFMVTGACGQSTAQMFDLASGAMIREFSQGANKPDMAVWFTHISPDGKQVTTGHSNGHERIWDAATGKLLKEQDRSLGYHATFAQTASNSPFIIFNEGAMATKNIITVRMTEEEIDRVIKTLTLEQKELIENLIQARGRKIQKQRYKPLVLPEDKLKLFKELPPFVQTALKINLKLVIEDDNRQTIPDRGDQKSN